MGVLRQFGLLLQRYLLIRKRQPVILLLEVLWPILIFLVVAVVRQGAPPSSKPNCYYPERATLKAGMLPFLQSYVCNLDNQCQTKDGMGVAQKRIQNLSALVGDLEPHLSNPDVINSLKSLKNATVLLETIDENLNNQTWLLDYIENGIPIRELLRDPEELRQAVVVKHRYIEGAVFDAVLNASLSLEGLFLYMEDLFNSTDVLCNATQLERYLLFEDEVDTVSVSKALCSINTTDLADFVETLQKHLDVAKIIKWLARVPGKYELQNAFNDLSLLLDLILNSPSVSELVKNFPQLLKLTDVLKSVPGWIKQFELMESKDTHVLQEMVHALDPIVRGLSKNSKVWELIKDGILTVDNFLSTFFHGPSSVINSWFTDPDKIETLLEGAGIPKTVVVSLLGVRVPFKQMINYVLVTHPSELLPLFCSEDRKQQLAVLCSDSADKTLHEKFFKLVNLTQFKHEALDISVNLVQPVRLYFKEALKFLEMLPDIPQEILDILSSITSIRIEDTLNILNQMFSGKIIAQDAMTMLTQYLGGLDNALKYLPSANMTHILLAIVDTSLSTVTEAVNTITGIENYLGHVFRNDLQLVDSINSLLALGPDVTKTVLQAFTHPHKLQYLMNNTNNLKTLFCDPDEFSKFLNVPKTPSFENVRQLFCTDNVTALTKTIIQKLNLDELERIFTEGVDEIESYVLGLKDPLSKPVNISAILWKSQVFYDSLMMAVKAMTRDWDALVKGVTHINMNGTSWSGVWSGFSLDIWTAGVSVLVERWGPVLEGSQLWPMVGPYVRTVDVIVKNVNRQNTELGNLIGSNSTIGHIMSDVLTYIPEMLDGFLSVAKNPTVIEKMITSPDIVSLLCDPVEVREMFPVPEYVPVEEMVEGLCSLDFNTLVVDIENVYAYDGLDKKIGDLLKDTGGMGSAKGFDWAQMIENAEVMYTQGQDPLQYTAMFTRIFSHMNFTELAVVWDRFWKEMDLLSPNEYGRLVNFGLSFGVQVDRMLANNTEWRIAKHYIHMYDQILGMFNTKGFGLSVNDIYPNATRLNELVHAVTAAVPDGIQAVTKILMNPFKLTQGLMSLNLTNPAVCENLNLASLLEVDDPTAIRRLKQKICTMDWNALAEELGQSPGQQELMDALSAYFSGRPVPNIRLNWPKIIQDVSDYFSMLSYNSSVLNPDLSNFGLNLTAIDIRFQELANASQRYTDPAIATKLSAEFIPLMEVIASQYPSLQDIWYMEKVYIYAMNEVILFANKNIYKFQGKKEVNLLHFLNSEELDKIAKVVSASPEVVHLLLETIMDIMADPARAATFSNVQGLMNVCNDPVLFEDFFPEAARAQIDIRATICNVSLVNITKMSKELLDNIGGLQEMITAIGKVTPDAPYMDIKLNMTQVTKNYEDFVQLLMDVTRNPPHIDIGLGTRVFNMTVWQDIIQPYGEKFEKVFKELYDWSPDNIYNMTLAMIEQQLVQYIQYPEFNEIMQILGHTARMSYKAMDKLLAGNTTSAKGFLKDYPTIERVFELSNNLPKIIATLTYTNSFNPLALTEMFQTVIGWESFCNVDISRYIEPMPGLNFDVGQFHTDMCALNTTLLTAEVQAFTGTTDLFTTRDITKVTTNWMENLQNMRNTVQDMGKLFKLYLQVLEKPPLSLFSVFSWLNQTVWENSFMELGKQLADPGTTLRMLENLDKLVPMFDNLTQSNRFLHDMWKVQKIEMYIVNEVVMLANKNLPRFEGKVNLLDFFQSNELEKIAEAVKASPEIVKLLFDTILDIMADPSKSSQFSDVQKFAQVCVNRVAFNQLFPEALTSRVDIQGVICNLTYINITNLLDELQSGVYGLSQMIQSLSKVFQPNATVNVSYKSMAKNYELFTELLVNLTRTPVEIDPGLGNQWDNASRWNQLWMDFNRQFVNISSHMGSMGIGPIVDSLLPLLEAQLSPFYSENAFSVILNGVNSYLTGTLRFLQFMNANSSAGIGMIWSEYPEVQKALSLLDQLPYMLTSLLDQKTSAGLSVVINTYVSANIKSFEEFCNFSIDLNRMLPGLSNSEGFSFAGIIDQVCQLNLTTLAQEVLEFSGQTMPEIVHTFRTENTTFGTIMYMSSVSIHYNITLSEVIRTLVDVVEEYQQLLQHPLTLPNFPLFNGAAWHKWFMRLNEEYQYGSVNSLLNMALSLRPTMEALLTGPIGKDVTPSMLRGLDGLVDFLTDFIQKLSVGKLPNIWTMYEKLPFFRNLVKLADEAPDIVNVFLDTVMDPVKSQYLFGLIANPNSTLGTFCNLTEQQLPFVFAKPKNSSLSLDQVQSLICSLDFNSIGMQLVNLTNTQFGFISDLAGLPSVPQSGPVNFTDFLNDLEYLDTALANLTTRPPSPSLFQQMNITDYLPFYNLFLPDTWKSVYGKLSAKLMANPASVFDLLESMRPVLGFLLQDPNSRGPAITILSGVDGMMVYLTDYFNMLQEGKLNDPWAVFNNAPSIQKIFSLLDQFPESTEVLIETMLSPSKSQSFLSLVTGQFGYQAFCNEPDLSQYFEVPVNSPVDLNAVRQKICGIDVLKIGEELANSSMTDFGFINQMFMSYLLPNGMANLTFNETEFFVHVKEFQWAFNNITLHPPNATIFTQTQIDSALPFLKWFDTGRWSQMFDRVYRRMATRPSDPAWIASVSEQLLNTLKMTGDDTSVRIINTMIYEFGIILDKLELLDGRSTFRLGDLFPDSPNIRQLANYLDSNPEVVEMILMSVESPQFQTLFTMNMEQALQEICQRPENYFKLPPSASKTVTELMEGFCVVNLTSLAAEFANELHIPLITNMSAPLTFNLTAYVLETQRLIQTWERQPLPMITLSTLWTNGTFWIDVFSRYAQRAQNPANDIQALMTALAPLFPRNDTTFQAVSVIMDEVVQLITAKLNELAGGTLSLDTLLDNATSVKILLERSLDITPDLIHAVFAASISSPDTLYDLIVSNNWKDRLCSQPGALQGVFNLPVTVNSTEVQKVICSINETALAADFMHLLGIDTIEAKLQKLIQGRLNVNWQEIFEHSQQLSAAIDNIIRNPPLVQLPTIDTAAMDRLSHNLLLDIGNPNTGMINLVKVLTILDRYLNGTPGWNVVMDYYKSSVILLEYFNKMLDMVSPRGGQFDLALLFGNSPRIRNLLDMAFHLGPDFVTGFLSATIKPEMVSAIVSGRFNPQTHLCSASEMRKYFSFHPGFNLTYAVDALCQINSSQILTDLKNTFDMDNLAQQLAAVESSTAKFDPLNYVRQTIEFNENIMKLVNITGLRFGNVDVIKYFNFNGSVDALLQNSQLIAFSPNVTSYATQLELMMPLIENTDFWKAVRPVLNAINILTDVINKKLTILETEPITLANLLKNATYFSEVLEKSFGIAPELVLVLNQASAKPEVLVGLFNSSNCLLNHLTLPPWANESALRDVLCHIDSAALIRELKSQINYDQILAEFRKIGENVTEPFSWRRFLSNIQTLEMTIGQLPKVHMTVPFFPDFLAELFSYHGDMGEWLRRLGMVAPSAAVFGANMQFDGLMYLKINLQNTLYSLESSLSPLRTSETLVRVMTAVGKMLKIVEDQLMSVERVNLKVVFQYSAVTVDPATLFSENPSLVDKFLSTVFKPQKLAELQTTTNRDMMLCSGPSSLDQVFDLPVGSGPALMNLFAQVFCNRSSPGYDLVQEAISTYQQGHYMVDVLGKLIGSSAYGMSQNTTGVIDRAEALLNEILPWPLPNQTEQVSPALLQLLKFWGKEVPSFNAKLYAAGTNIFLSLFERGSQVSSQYSRFGQAMSLIVDTATSLLHSFLDGSIDLYTLFRDNSGLMKTVTANKEIMQALFAGHVRLDKLLPLFSRPDGREDFCDMEKFNQIFDFGSGNFTLTAVDLHSVLCQNNSQFFQELSRLLNTDFNRIGHQLQQIFDPNNTAPTVDWADLYLKTDSLVQLIIKVVDQPAESFFQRMVQYWTGSQLSLHDTLHKLMMGDPHIVSNLVGMIGGTLSSVIPTPSYLYPIFQYIDGPVLQQIAQQVKMFRFLLESNSTDSELNLDTLAEGQVESMGSVDLIRDSVCDVAKVGEVWNQTQITAMAVSQALCRQSTDTWYQNLVGLGMSSTDILAFTSMLQGYFFSLALTDQRQNPPLSALDWSTFSSRLESLMKEIGIPLPGGSDMGSWQSIMNKIGAGSLQSIISAIDVLKLVDPMIKSKFWDTGKKYLQLVTDVFKITNEVLGRMTVTNATLKLVNLYPNPEQMRAALQAAIGPEFGANFLSASIQPEQLLSLVSEGSLQATVCNETLFDQTFTFDEAINSTAINSTAMQIELCRAAMTNATVIDKLVTMLDARKLIQEASELAKDWKKDHVMTGWSFWENVKKELEKFRDIVYKLGTVQHVDMSTPKGWSHAVLFSVNHLMTPDVYSQSCTSVISLMDKEYYDETLKPIFTTIMTAVYLIQEELKVTSDFDDIVCELPGESLPNIIRRLRDIHLFDLIDKFLTRTTKLKPFNCKDMSNIMYNLLQSDKSIQSVLGRPFNETSKCLGELLKSGSQAVKDVDTLFDMMSVILEILQDNNLVYLSSNINSGLKMAMPYVELFLKAVLGQKQVATTLSELISNETDVSRYLVDILQFSPKIIDAFFKSTVNLDIVRILNNTVDSIENILCNPTELSKYVTVPEGLNETLQEISTGLCKANLNEAIGAVKAALDVGRIALELSKLGSGTIDPVWFQGLATHISSLMTEIQGLSKILSIDFTKVNFNEALPEIQKFLKSSGPEVIIDTVSAIINDFRAITTDETGQSIIDTLDIVNRGLLASDLVRMFFIPDIKDMLEDPQGFRQHMIDDLEFSPEVADAILNSEVSVESQKLVKRVTDVVCTPYKLRDVLLLDKNQTSGITIVDISTALCRLDSESLANFTSIVFKGIDIRRVLNKFLTYSIDGLFEGSGVAMTDAEEVFKELQGAQEDFKKASEILDKINEEVDVANLLPSAKALTSGAGVDAISKFMCGKKTNLGDEFQLTGLVGSDDEGDDPTADAGMGDSPVVTDKDVRDAGLSQNELDEIYAMPTPFCQDMLRDVYRYTGETGSILWTYLKPLLLGKIPYYPNTPETLEIVRKANGTFAMLENVNRLAREWANGGEDLKVFAATARKQSTVTSLLSSSLVSRMMEQSLGVSGKVIRDSLEQLGSVSEEQLEQLGIVSNLLVNYTDCLNLDRWQPLDTAEQVFKASQELSKSKEMMAAIEFISVGDDPKRKKRQAESSTLSKNIVYKIRMDMDNVPSTTFLKQAVWRPVPEANFAEDLRYLRGFVQLQEMIDRAIIESHTGDNGTFPSVYHQQFPFPCHEEDVFLHYLSYYLLPLMMTLAWMGSLGVAVKILLYDREKGLEETMKVMGLKSGVNWLAWLLVTMIFMILVAVLEVVILKVANILRFSNWFLLILFITDFCFSSVMMCYMVSAFFTRANMAALTSLIVYVLSYLPFVMVTALEQQMSFTEKMLSCLSSTTAFGFACQYMSRFEEQLVGIQWHNTWKSSLDNDLMSFSWACIMMLVDGLIYMIIGWYVRNIIPRKYGVPLPWYFPVWPAYWGCAQSTPTVKTRQGLETHMFTDRQLIEHCGSGQEAVGISLQNLTKVYSGEPAVDKLSVDFFKGQITSLLGHNGAGKTTTINMLSGVTRPSRGSAMINGLDIYTDLSEIRKDIGICPQHNSLFDFMTVKEHLELYIGLKGNFSGKSAKEEVNRMLDSVDLYEEKDVVSAQLSGGMKRRLCVALAFVGGADTVILDEPTSGVDPSARRGVWDVILHNRFNRTILLSTHHLDEADVLSDRIAILHEGKLLCCGSSMFLKKQLGNGYHLTAISDPESSSQSSSAKESSCSDTATSLLDLIRKYIPDAEIQEEMGKEVKINLFATEAEKASFHRLFMDIDDQMSELGITSYGVSDTTLEEVFLKACYLADTDKPFTAENLKGSPKETSFNGSSDGSTGRTTNTELASLVQGKKTERATGAALVFQQFGALFMKRFHHYRRDWRLLFTLIVLPLVFMAAGMGFALIQKSLDNVPPIVLTPSMYGSDQFSFLKQQSKTDMFNRMVTHMNSDPGFGTTCMPDMRKWKYITDEFQCVANPSANYSAMVSMGNKPVNCTCKDYRYSCDRDADMPPQRLTKTGIVLQKLDNVEIADYLLDSFDQFKYNRFGGWSYEDGDKTRVWFNNKGHHALPAYMNTLSNAVLRSRLPPSENPAEYGITTINHPYRLTAEPLTRDTVMQKAGEIGVAMVVLLAFSFVVASFIIYLVDERIRREKRLQHISGVSVLTYWIAAFIWDMIIFAIAVGLAVAIMAIFRIPSYWDRENLAAIVILLLLFGAANANMMYMTAKLFDTAATAYMTLFCMNMLIGIVTCLTIFLLSFFTYFEVIAQVHRILKYVFMIFPQYCLGEGLIRITKNQLLSELLSRFGEDVYKSPYNMNFLGWLFVAMAIQAVCFFIITLLTELETSPLFRNKKSKENALEDDDVAEEHYRVMKSKPSDHVVMARNLSKLYLRGLKKVVAVDKASFGINPGECFGLLGVNGAGKTTTFKMLIGDTRLSGGEAYLNGKSVRHLSSEERQKMGYCPQSDALDDYVSGRELLYCHAKLKGTSSSEAKQVINALSISLDMESFINNATKTYSGGMKRKLSLAIAVLGRPDVIYLDEPTAGMDPGNKRLVWNLILDLVKGGSSIVLTSHSMEECDILCNRLAIMVNGKFVCLGSPQHLKNKFSEGYRVIIKVKGLASNGHELVAFMLSHFPGTRVKDQHQGTFEFAIPSESAILPNIFGHLERQKSNLQIEDYSVQQTTLDAVFLHFAKCQTDGLSESPDGSVTDTDVEMSKPIKHSDVGLSRPFVNESYAFMNPQLGLHEGVELQPANLKSGYYSKNLDSDVKRHSSHRSEKGKLNPLFPVIDGDEVTHL